MRTIEMYENAPDGSTLEVRLTPEGGPFTGNVLFSTSGPVDDVTWPDADIRPGPKKQPLSRGKAYMVEFHLAFMSEATATIATQIRKPNGDLYSTPKVWEVDGQQGDPELRVLIIRTEA
ncbi:MAG TPA: hypothetical protein VF173_37335 [Thermoanaerobaculia bacterium]|nr:hypothetical protein [Thermoanaerobaculia bacterium]